MSIWQESRESLFIALAPAPYLVALLPVVSFAAELDPLLFIFVLSLIASFFYLLVKRSLGNFRSKIAMRKNNTPDENGKYLQDGYWVRFKKLSQDANFAEEIDIDPITEYTERSLFPYAVYGFWGLLWSIAMFVISGGFLAWLVSGSSFESIVEDPAVGNLLQSLPLGTLEVVSALSPLFGSLDLETRVVIWGVVLVTGFTFLTAARNLIIITDDLHRRALRYLVVNNPLVQNELVNAIGLAMVYVVLLLAM